MQVVSRGRLAPGDGQWPRGGAADQQADQSQGHRARAQGVVQVAAVNTVRIVSGRSWNVSSFVPILADTS